MFEDWKHYRNIPITGSPDGAKTNYQVQIDVGWSSEYIRPDFGDIRFVSEDLQTEYTYAMTYLVESSTATFIVKIPSLPASPTITNIKMLCDNPDAVTTSDPENTFDYYQNLTGSTTPDIVYNPSGLDEFAGWDNNDARFDEANDRIIVYDGTNSGGSIKLNGVDNETGFILEINNVEMPDEALALSFFESNASNLIKIQYTGYTTDNWKAWKVIGGSGTQLGTTVSGTNGLNAKLTLYATPTGFIFKYGTTTIFNYSGALPVADGIISLAAGGGGVGSHCYITGDLTLRQYTANPPTVGSMGVWEELNPKTNLKTLFEVLRPHLDLKTLFTVRRWDENDLLTQVCIRRPLADLKTLFSIKLFSYNNLKTLFTVKRNVVTYHDIDLKTLFTVNINSKASELKTLLFINGFYRKSINLHGSIINSENPKKRKGNNYIKVMIGDEIYV